MRRNAKSENYLHITDKSERGRRALVVASQTVGVLAECRPSRRPFPFVSGQSFLFPMPVAFELIVIPSPLSVRVFRLELITTSSTRLQHFFNLPKECRQIVAFGAVQKNANLADLEKCCKMRLCSLS